MFKEISTPTILCFRIREIVFDQKKKKISGELWQHWPFSLTYGEHRLMYTIKHVLLI